MLAKSSGFQQRESKIKPKEFLELAFFENSDGCSSLGQHCAGLYMGSGKRISKQALDKRFRNKAKDFVGSLVEKVLNKQLSGMFKHCKAAQFFPEIRAMDSTEFVLSPAMAEKFPGYGGAGREAIAQVQFEYDLLNGKVTCLQLGNGLESDVAYGIKQLDSTPKGSLLLRDMGYASLNAFELLMEKQLFFISRLKPQVKAYQLVAGNYKELTKEAMVKQLKQGKEKYLDLKVYLGKNKKLPVRLTANLLDEKQKQRRMKKKQANRGKAYPADALNASINIFVTNVEKATCCPQQLYCLYKLRWQIELVFKAWKSILNIHKANPMNPERFQCMIYIKFLWVLLNWSLVKLFSTMSKTEVSLYKTTYTVRKQAYYLRYYLLQGQLTTWLWNLFETNLIYNKKEYKKESLKITEILNFTS